MNNSFFSLLCDAVATFAAEGLNQFFAQVGIVAGAYYGYTRQSRGRHLVRVTMFIIALLAIALVLVSALWQVGSVTSIILEAVLIWVYGFGLAGFSVGWVPGVVVGFCVGRLRSGRKISSA
jgi:hypothetical protein